MFSCATGLVTLVLGVRLMFILTLFKANVYVLSGEYIFSCLCKAYTAIYKIKDFPFENKTNFSSRAIQLQKYLRFVEMINACEQF